MQFEKKNTRAEQSRINGAKSRGPSSPEGKKKSSQNARKLGLYATRDVPLTTEEQEDLDALRERYYAEWRPVDQRQQDTVDQIVHAQWQYLRYACMEKWLIDNQISKMRQEIPLMYGDREPAFDLRAVLAYDRVYKDGPTLLNLQRELRAIARTIRQLNAELRKFQAENPPILEEEEQDSEKSDPKPEQTDLATQEPAENKEEQPETQKLENEPEKRLTLAPPPHRWTDMDSPRIDTTLKRAS